MKNIFIYIGLALIIAGAVIGQFTGIEAASWIELVGFAAGLATCSIGIVKKAEKKDWKLYVAIAAIAVGTILMVWAGISQSVISSVISTVIGLVVLVTGLLPVLLSKKNG
ncbi:MAG: hypothetical protein K5786_07225 [Treponema sp.]|jgi:uncharacterized membrane protein YjjB (DUF3815 family)|nr:hypothetical protein [Treponema sp.]